MILVLPRKHNLEAFFPCQKNLILLILFYSSGYGYKYIAHHLEQTALNDQGINVGYFS